MRITLTMAALLVSGLMLVGCASTGHGHDHGAKCCSDDPAKCCKDKVKCAECEECEAAAKAE